MSGHITKARDLFFLFFFYFLGALEHPILEKFSLEKNNLSKKKLKIKIDFDMLLGTICTLSFR